VTPVAFQKLALALREAGAVRVKAGDMEAVWATPLLPQQVPVHRPQSSGNGHRQVSAEEERMRAYRAELMGDDA
jgi:hypothetical protein